MFPIFKECCPPGTPEAPGGKEREKYEKAVFALVVCRGISGLPLNPGAESAAPLFLTLVFGYRLAEHNLDVKAFA